MATKETKTKRARHVFPTDEIAHLWAHKVQADARNSQGNFYFEGDTIYSYRSHFPIARHVANKRGKRAILFTTRSYSVTTGGHISAVRQAIPSGITVFDVDNIHDYSAFAHRDNLRAFASDAKSNVQKSTRCRKQGTYTLDAAFRLRDSAREYCKFFGIKFSANDWRFLPKGKRLAELRAMLAEREARAKVLDNAKRARDRAEWEARSVREKAEADAWNDSGVCQHEPRHDAHQWGHKDACKRLHEDEEWMTKSGEIIVAWQAGDTDARLRNTWDLPTYLRIMDGELETSRGARIPMAHAVRGLKFVRMVVSRGEDWQRNGHTFHLGHYSLDRVEACGTVHAGCHVIEYREIQRIAPQVEYWERTHAAEVQAAVMSADSSSVGDSATGV